MLFRTPKEALRWLDENPDCQKAFYVGPHQQVFIGDKDDLPPKSRILWHELSLCELEAI